MTSWAISHELWETEEKGNTAWDIWLGPIDVTNPGTPEIEVMVWLNKEGMQPVGQKETDVTIWGVEWDVWHGNH